MKQTITVEQAVVAYGSLSASKLGKLSADGQVSVLKFLRATRPVSEEYQKFAESVQKKARAKEVDFEAFQKSMKDENSRRLSLEYERLSEEDVKVIFANNDNLTGNDMIAIEDALLKTDKA